MRYKKGFKYQLVRMELFRTSLRPSKDISIPYITLGTKGLMVLDRGYAWDGASGPTIDTDNTMRGSAYHDAAYQLMRLELLRPHWRGVADEELGVILRASGMSKLRSKLWVRGLDIFGRPAADPKNRRKVYEVT